MFISVPMQALPGVGSSFTRLRDSENSGHFVTRRIALPLLNKCSRRGVSVVLL